MCLLCDIWSLFFFSFIQPCRSLCVAVRDSCAPVLACQGHPWPEVLDCDRFPAEEDMCLSPHAKFSHFAKGMCDPQTNCQLWMNVLPSSCLFTFPVITV